MMPEEPNTAVGPTVGVIIVTYNSAEHLDDLFTSLDSALAGVQFRLVVIDNQSSDGTAQRVRDLGYEAVEMGRNAGYSAAINAGVRALDDASTILLLNPDVVLDPAAVVTMLAVSQDPRVGVVVPQTRDVGGALSPSLRRDPSLPRVWSGALLGAERVRNIALLSERVANPDLYLRSHDVDWGVGAIMLITRECINRVGDWDESFFLYSEETDFCQRVRRSGLAVRYDPSAVAYHEGGGGVHNPRLRSMMVVNKVRLYRRQHSLVASSLFYFASVLNEASRAAMGNTAARSAAASLMFPSRRPPEIQCSDSFLPR